MEENLDYFEDKEVYDKNFKIGFEQGLEASKSENYTKGYKEGVQKGLEIGYYSGYFDIIKRSVLKTNNEENKLTLKISVFLEKYEKLKDTQNLEEIKKLYKLMNSTIKTISKKYNQDN